MLAFALAAALGGCASWDMSERQLDRALYRMTLAECHSRARAALGDARRDELERASSTHECLKMFAE